METEPDRRLNRLFLGVRRELLRVLDSLSDVRADLIRQMHQRPHTRDLAEVLMDLEADPAMMIPVVEALRNSVKE
jgi:ACT domain-containing protein